MTEKINGGYVLKARRIQDSKIAHSPPHVREVWDYLIRMAEYSGRRIDGRDIERGQVFTDTDKITEGLHWWAGARKMKYSRHDIKNALRALRDNTMITSLATPRGVIVTIVNYDFYQDRSNYGNTAGNTTTTPPATPQNDSKTTAEFSEDVEKMFAFFCKELGVQPNGVRGNEDWRDVFRLMIEHSDKSLRKDKREMCKVIRWVAQDIATPSGGNDWRGWRAQIKSPANFRKKYETLLERSLAPSKGEPQRLKPTPRDFLENLQ